MNRALLAQTWRWQLLRFAILAVVAVGWGWLIVFIYTTFSPLLREMLETNPMFEQLSQFGSGNFFSVPGALTLGFQHPFLIAIIGAIAAGSSATAIAGERQGGTLEVLLARPLSRRGVYLSILVALVALVALLVLALLIGMVVGLTVHDLAGEVDLGGMPLVLANGALLWGAFATFGLAASVSFDRVGPALGLSIGFLVVNYFVEILGSLWTDVAWSQEYSLFHHFQPQELLTGAADPLDFVIVGLAFLLPIAYALIVFPRRDLAAPS
jgi:ABC-type transport system involved in multi-copper enzyme maturation permease subunit